MSVVARIVANVREWRAKPAAERREDTINALYVAALGAGIILSGFITTIANSITNH